ncbi:MAG: ABC transporter ATP-binding protein [Anaerolineales bacterium]|nr:ABC transporter ATP-binding protein [Anaerolineales bacterium]
MSGKLLAGLWRITAGYRLTYLGALLFVGIGALSRTLTSLLLSAFVDDVLVPGRFELLPMVVGGFVGLAVVQGGLGALSGRMVARTAEGIAQRLRNFVYDHIQRLSFSYHDHMPTGELIQRATSDVDALRRFFSDQAVGFGRTFLLFGTNFAALLNLDVRLALLSVIAVPVVIAVSYFFFGKISKVYDSYQDQEAIVSTTLQENLTGVRVVKAFARQGYERDKFERDNAEKYRRGKRLTLMNAVYWPSSDIICGVQMLFGFYLAARMAIAGTITPGGYLAYVSLIMWLIWPIRNLGRLIVQMSSGLVSYGRLATLIHEEWEPLEDGDPELAERDLRGEVVFQETGFQYDGTAPVLTNISFRCAPGQSVALLGSTGSGKTSLVNLLPRFYDYTSGTILLDGRELRDYPRHFLRRNIGIVEQEPFLFSRSIRENITYGVARPVTQDEVEAAARAAAIHDVIVSFPDGYDTLVGERGVTLSGGQKQRVAIARTLLKDPRILILDDSTSSVDTETEGQIREALEHLMRGRTTFIIAHRIQSVMDADLILVLDRGKIIQMGQHAELMAQEGVYQRIYNVQARIEVELEEEMNRVAH